MAIAYSLDSMSKGQFKIGYGEDIHRLVPNRKLILGGVDIPFELGLDGHSDADVVYHALSDALLSALALGDIGLYFSPSDDKFLNLDSSIIVKECYEKVKSRGYMVSNLTIFIVCERPKLRRFIDDMRNNISRLLAIDIECVGISAGTNEGMGDIGQGKAIKAIANVLLERSEL